MTWNKFWMAYDLMFVAVNIASAFFERRDTWIRVNGWVAIILVVCAVIQWKRVEEESSHD